MRRLLSILLILGLPTLALAQSAPIVRYGNQFHLLAESDPYPCDSTTEGHAYNNTTDNEFYRCDGTAWGTLGSAIDPTTDTDPIANDNIKVCWGTGGCAADSYIQYTGSDMEIVTVAGDLILNSASEIVFGSAVGAADAIWKIGSSFVGEGSTANAQETTIAIGDATTDGTLTITSIDQGATDHIAFTSGKRILFDSAANQIYFGDSVGAANSLFIGHTASSSITFEGATADDFEGTLAPSDPTADRTWTLPDESGTVLTTASGDLYENSAGTNITVATAGTYYPWISATAGPLVGGMTVDTGDAAGDHFIVPKAGTYLVNLSVSYTANNSAATIWRVAEDGVADPSCEFSRTMGAAAAIGVGATSCLITMAASGELRAEVTSDTNGHVVTVHNVDLVATYIGS